MPHVKNFIHDTIRLSVYCILGYKIKSYSMFSGLTSFFYLENCNLSKYGKKCSGTLRT